MILFLHTYNINYELHFLLYPLVHKNKVNYFISTKNKLTN